MARRLKYSGPDTDLQALESELKGSEVDVESVAMGFSATTRTPTIRMRSTPTTMMTTTPTSQGASRATRPQDCLIVTPRTSR